MNKAELVLECVQQNMNDKVFIDWLYETLGLDCESGKWW